MATITYTTPSGLYRVAQEQDGKFYPQLFLNGHWFNFYGGYTQKQYFPKYYYNKSLKTAKGAAAFVDRCEEQDVEYLIQDKWNARGSAAD